MEAEIELRRLCTNLAIDALSKGKKHYYVDLGKIMRYAKTLYFISKSMEASDN